MKTELSYKGYKINIRQDECPENPFEVWDCEPPLIACTGSRHGGASYYQNAPEGWRELVGLLPASCFERKNRVGIFKKLLGDKMTIREFAEILAEWSNDLPACISDCLDAHYGQKPEEGWSQAGEWLDTAESLLKHGGIPCLSTQSNGYSQGDSTLLLVILTPEWLKMTGCKPERFAESLQQTADLYGAWAWGDVYGISEILDPTGDEIENGSCWGFYGSDHNKSGLLEHAKSSIDWHLEQVEQTALNEPACLI